MDEEPCTMEVEGADNENPSAENDPDQGSATASRQDEEDVVRTCILCGSDSYHLHSKLHTGKSTRHWSKWRTDYARSFCSLFALSPKFLQLRIANGPYCLQCSSTVWDIHFTMKQVSALEHRLRTLKERIENKVGRYCNQLSLEARGEETKPQTVQLIAQGLGITTRDFPEIHEPQDESDFHWNSEQVDQDDFNSDQENARNRGTIFAVGKGQIKQERLDRTHHRDPDWCPDDFEADEIEDYRDRASASCSLLRETKRPRGRPPKGSIPIIKVKRPRGRPPTKTKVVNKQPPLPRKPPIGCPRCEATFRFKRGLKLHLAREHPECPEKQFACSVCSRRYREEATLEAHIENMHGTGFAFHCPTCKYGFNTQEELTEHEPIHQSANPFTCFICHKVFTKTADLERHMPIHRNPFRCEHPGCETGYATQELLDIHVKRHSRSMVCDMCGMAFSSRGALSSHMSAHTEERNYKCDICPLSYKTKAALARHMVTHTTERPHLCRICGKGFQLSYMRNRHEQIHSGLRPYVCSTCGKNWATRNGLNQHETETHGGRNRGGQRYGKKNELPNPNPIQTVQEGEGKRTEAQSVHSSSLSE